MAPSLEPYQVPLLHRAISSIRCRNDTKHSYKVVAPMLLAFHSGMLPRPLTCTHSILAGVVQCLLVVAILVSGVTQSSMTTKFSVSEGFPQPPSLILAYLLPSCKTPCPPTNCNIVTSIYLNYLPASHYFKASHLFE